MFLYNAPLGGRGVAFAYFISQPLSIYSNLCKVCPLYIYFRQYRHLPILMGTRAYIIFVMLDLPNISSIKWWDWDTKEHGRSDWSTWLKWPCKSLKKCLHVFHILKWPSLRLNTIIFFFFRFIKSFLCTFTHLLIYIC